MAHWTTGAAGSFQLFRFHAPFAPHAISPCHFAPPSRSISGANPLQLTSKSPCKPATKKGGGGFEQEGEKKQPESKDMAEWGS